MRFLVSAGEPSGDSRGAELLGALSATTSVEAFGMGGECLKAAGMDIVVSQNGMSVMGFTGVLPALPRILAAESALRRLALSRRPDALILVDYPGFNMRLGAWARKRGIPVVQYIAPQLWAWGRWRMRRLSGSCDLLVVILPFEEEFFRQRGIRAFYAGHPLADTIPGPRPEPSGPTEIALLPGSRRQEVKRLLPEMLGAYRILRSRGLVDRAVIAAADSVGPGCYPSPEDGLSLVCGPSGALGNARAALVCSGTATLETAMHGVPQVICYRTGKFNFLMARLLVRGVERIGLANLVAGKDIAPELLQERANAGTMAAAVEGILGDGAFREGTARVREMLGPGGGATRAAAEILSFLEQR